MSDLTEVFGKIVKGSENTIFTQTGKYYWAFIAYLMFIILFLYTV